MERYRLLMLALGAMTLAAAPARANPPAKESDHEYEAHAYPEEHHDPVAVRDIERLRDLQEHEHLRAWREHEELHERQEWDHWQAWQEHHRPEDFCDPWFPHFTNQCEVDAYLFNFGSAYDTCPHYPDPVIWFDH